MLRPSRPKLVFKLARRWCVGALAAGVAQIGAAGLACAQDSTATRPATPVAASAGSQTGGPLFFTDTAADGHWVDAHDAAVLQRRVSITLIGVPLSDALEGIAGQARVTLSYSPDLLPLGARVSIKASDAPLGAVLGEVLSHAGQDVLVRADGSITLVPHQVVADAADSSRLVTGAVVGAANGEGVPYATVALLGTEHARFADSSGRFRLARLAPRAYILRARQIGYQPVDTTVMIGPDPTVVTVTLRMHRIPALLGPVIVTGGRGKGCAATGVPDPKTNPTLAAIFGQVRENVDRTQLLSDQYPFRYTREERRVIRRSPGGDSTEYVDSLAYESSGRLPYQVGDVVFYRLDTVFHRAGPGDVPKALVRRHMYLPVFNDLADSTFLAAHCFSLGAIERDKTGATMFRIDFAPANHIATPDVEGSIYIDARSLLVRRAFVVLTKPGAAKPPLINFSVMTTFRPIIPLVPLVDSMGSEQLIGTAAGQVDPSRAVSRLALTTDRMISVSFERGAPESHARPPAVVPQPSPSVPSATPSPAASGVPRIRAFFPADPSCKVQPAADTIGSLVYATMRAAAPVHMQQAAWSRYASHVLAAVRESFVLPTDLTLQTFSLPFSLERDTSSRATTRSDAAPTGVGGPKLYIAPTLSTTAQLTLGPDGTLQDARIVVSSGSAAVDTVMIAAIRRAAVRNDFPKADSTQNPAGSVTVDLDLALAQSSVEGVVMLGRVQEPAWLWERNAALDERERQPSVVGNVEDGDPLADTATFEFVVDARGQALRSTARALRTGSAKTRQGPSAFERRVLLSLSRFRFTPAVVASCPVSQLIVQGFGYKLEPTGAR